MKGKTTSDTALAELVQTFRSNTKVPCSRFVTWDGRREVHVTLVTPRSEVTGTPHRGSVELRVYLQGDLLTAPTVKHLAEAMGMADLSMPKQIEGSAVWSVKGIWTREEQE